MTWTPIPNNPNWEYDSAPPDPGGAQSALWSTGINGIRTTPTGQEVYMNCRPVGSDYTSRPSEISKTFWDAVSGGDGGDGGDGGGGGELWTPQLLTTSYWWDASDTSTIVESSNTVTSWTDKTQGLQFTQGSIAQPTTNTSTINSLNVLDFNGSQQLVGTTPGLTQYTKFIVFKRNTNSAANNTLSGVCSPQSQDAIWSGSQQGGSKLSLFQDGTNVQGTTDLLTGIPYQCAGTWDGYTLELFLDGALEAEGNDLTQSNGNGLELGTFFNTYGLNGSIAEIVLMPKVASLEERQIVEGYLAHKWDIIDSLDAGHPYKASAPLATDQPAPPANPLEVQFATIDFYDQNVTITGTLRLERYSNTGGRLYYSYTTSPAASTYTRNSAASYYVNGRWNGWSSSYNLVFEFTPTGVTNSGVNTLYISGSYDKVRWKAPNDHKIIAEFDWQDPAIRV